MFGFGKSGILKDVEEILETVEYRLLRVAWEEFVRFRPKHDDQEMFTTTTPTWIALEIVANYEGKLGKMAPSEVKFLQLLRRSPDLYTEVVQVLSSCEYTDDDACHAFDTHHDLADVVTNDYQEYRTSGLIQILIEVARQYQMKLQALNEKHGDEIDKVIAKLESKNS